MIKTHTIVAIPTGIHARPASIFAKVAAQFGADVTVRNVTKEREAADAKSMIALMLLGISAGDQIEITADGPDEQKALERLRSLAEHEGEL